MSITENLSEAFSEIFGKYKQLVIGAVLGSVLMLVIFLSEINLTIYLQIATLLVLAWSIWKPIKPAGINQNSNSKPGVHEPCSECGSMRRHKGSCPNHPKNRGPKTES